MHKRPWLRVGLRQGQAARPGPARKAVRAGGLHGLWASDVTASTTSTTNRAQIMQLTE